LFFPAAARAGRLETGFGISAGRGLPRPIIRAAPPARIEKTPSFLLFFVKLSTKPAIGGLISLFKRDDLLTSDHKASCLWRR
jgi:hypothetical protein